MKKIAVMQPYLFPYLGYFQLIEAADIFVFYDDVNFITNGWIHRNRVLVNNKASYFTIPCLKASQNKLINEIDHALDKKSRRKLLNKIKFAYKSAPYFDDVYPIFENVIHSNQSSISELAIQSVKDSAEYLDIKTIFKKSSEHFDNASRGRADRLIDIAIKEAADTYINAVGGKKIYEKSYFLEKGIELQFLKPSFSEYKQFGEKFTDGLSIIDVMMFNSVERIQSLLKTYSLE